MLGVLADLEQEFWRQMLNCGRSAILRLNALTPAECGEQEPQRREGDCRRHHRPQQFEDLQQMN